MLTAVYIKKKDEVNLKSEFELLVNYSTENSVQRLIFFEVKTFFNVKQELFKD